MKTQSLETEMMFRWVSLIEALGHSPRKAMGLAGMRWPLIVSRYSEPHRYYHNLTHIRNLLLGLYRDPRIGMKDSTTIELAIWFHDIIYDTQSNRNEEESANYAREVMSDLGVDLLTKAEVIRMIHLTKHSSNKEEVIEKTWQEKLFLDLDLSILAAPPEQFKEYDVNIRKEYSWVPDEMYWPKRTELLDSFLQREFIFEDMLMRANLEHRARFNLTHIAERK